MAKEISFGIIPLSKRAGVWHVLLIKHLSGNHWSFPKGKPNENETSNETAVRELYEETGLKIKRYIVEDPVAESYRFTRDGKIVKKTVNYFIAEVEGDVFLDNTEIGGGKWVPLFESVSHVTFPEARQVCRRVLDIFDKF